MSKATNDKMWVAVDTGFGGWITSSRALTEEEQNEVWERSRVSVNLEDLGIGMNYMSVTIKGMMLFETKKAMTAARKEGFDKVREKLWASLEKSLDEEEEDDE